ncbi:MAG: glycoside hydrolase family 19 protein [bacterium]
MITDDFLKQIMPKLADAKRAAFLQPLQSAMNEFGVNTPQREAAFLAQIAHESGEFRWMEEIWGPTPAQQRYEPPKDLARKLGNTQPGDGKRFKGRGPIQITGRANYEKYGGMLGIDLVNNPEKAATPEVGFRVAGLFWQKNGLNDLADKEMFETTTRRINGGINGLDDRLKYYARAKEILGVRTARGVWAPESDRDLPPFEEFTRGREVVDTEPSVKKARKARAKKSKRAPVKSAKKKASGKNAGKKKAVKKTAGSKTRSRAKAKPKAAKRRK